MNLPAHTFHDTPHTEQEAKGLLQLLIVEDEYYIRKKLVSMLRWEELSISVAADVDSVEAAIDILKKQRIDLILSDIMLETASGLSLAEYVHTHGLPAKIVFLSGYNRFEYAQQAIEYGVSSYLLKPVSRERLRQVMQGLAEQLARVQQPEPRRSPLADEAARQAVRWALFSNERPPAELEPAYAELRRSILDGGFAVFLFRHVGVRQPLEVNVAFSKRMSEFPAACTVVKTEPAFYALLLHCSMEQTAALQNAARELLHSYFGIPLLFGESGWRQRPQQLADAYFEARRALERRFFGIGADASSAARENTEQTERVLAEQTAQLRRYVLAQDASAVERALQALFRTLRESAPELRRLEQLSAELFRMLGKTGYDHCRATGLTGASPEHISACFDSVHAMEQWFERAFAALPAERKGGRGEHREQLAQKMMSEIDERYSDFTLSLDTLAEQFGYSKSYCADLFRKATGYSVVEYITQCRMKQAQQLLLENPDEKISVICRRVGYQNQFYFSRRFKQFFGVAPGRIGGRDAAEPE